MRLTQTFLRRFVASFLFNEHAGRDEVCNIYKYTTFPQNSKGKMYQVSLHTVRRSIMQITEQNYKVMHVFL